MKKLMTLAAAAILFAGSGTITLNAAETETTETEITETAENQSKALKDGLKNGILCLLRQIF